MIEPDSPAAKTRSHKRSRQTEGNRPSVSVGTDSESQLKDTGHLNKKSKLAHSTTLAIKEQGVSTRRALAEDSKEERSIRAGISSIKGDIRSKAVPLKSAKAMIHQNHLKAQEAHKNGQSAATGGLPELFPAMSPSAPREAYQIPASIAKHLMTPNLQNSSVVDAVSGWKSRNRAHAVRYQRRLWRLTQEAVKARQLTNEEWEGEAVEESSLPVAVVHSSVFTRRGVPVGEKTEEQEWKRENREWRSVIAS
ncbi:uncharacterized protein HMPREF1541_04549 [Cyphellophora europaea CBS 101466]|uniref:Uncharacterized protein n=1 Tax=Cyphellophora europaea (strain CBS 101466) TaxID=1220924 RepID=W2RWV8_CYPE1|nr:uncharacterized protein HMPREF1541_04549 [Cyphellophora europaea CBS 101466]ETN40273.1 hypothetical protein HMPREF1541_04549 [Cyphellophora europaea CBS 101466]